MFISEFIKFFTYHWEKCSRKEDKFLEKFGFKLNNTVHEAKANEKNEKVGRKRKSSNECGEKTLKKRANEIIKTSSPPW